MRYLTVLQVGDVHYPDHRRRDADIKDSRLPTALMSATTSAELQAATRALLAVADQSPGAVLAFTGDLTSRGDLTEYENCVQYINDAFLLSDATRWSLDQLHAVPGNHDVNRALAATAPAGDLYRKFEPLTLAWSTKSVDILAVQAARRTTVTDGICSMSVFGVNSCLGCGERREQPVSLADELLKQLTARGMDAGAARAAIDDALASEAEVLDAPAYSEEQLQFIFDAIRAGSPKTLPILIAHHNLLQQAQPRFDLYTDLINGGLMRARMTSLDVPIIYLHGHIHSDPVESVTQKVPDSGQLISISAPEFRDGFNKIDIAFGPDATPIGCKVTRFRVRLHGGTSTDPMVRVRFNSYTSHVSPLANDIALCLLKDPTVSSLRQLYRNLVEETPGLDIDSLASALEELEWLELVEILNYPRPVTDWRFRVTIQHD